jgi:hypothetical protein
MRAPSGCAKSWIKPKMYCLVPKVIGFGTKQPFFPFRTSCSGTPPFSCLFLGLLFTSFPHRSSSSSSRIHRSHFNVSKTQDFRGGRKRVGVKERPRKGIYRKFACICARLSFLSTPLVCLSRDFAPNLDLSIVLKRLSFCGRGWFRCRELLFPCPTPVVILGPQLLQDPARAFGDPSRASDGAQLREFGVTISPVGCMRCLRCIGSL